LTQTNKNYFFEYFQKLKVCEDVIPYVALHLDDSSDLKNLMFSYRWYYVVLSRDVNTMRKILYKFELPKDSDDIKQFIERKGKSIRNLNIVCNKSKCKKKRYDK